MDLGKIFQDRKELECPRDSKGFFTDPEIRIIQEAIQEAIQKGFEKLEKEFLEREHKPEFQDLLGRKLEISDQECTLLVAVHSIFTMKQDGQEIPTQFVMACQVGDGVTATVACTNKDTNPIQLLGKTEGEYSGQTEFITSPVRTDTQTMAMRTHISMGNLRCLFVMSDGVADDYFPQETELPRLFCDLVINGIIEVP